MALANLRSVGSMLSGGHSSHGNGGPNMDDIVKEGYLEKRKNMKKRYFVLHKETSKESPARLEYYESQKKFSDGSRPRKKYILKDFYISRKLDSKSRFVFALFNKDCIALIAESEKEMQDWLQNLNYQKSACCSDNTGSLKIEYEHVWRVDIQNRGVGSTKKLCGVRLVVLTNWSLWLVRYENYLEREIVLSSIKRCGHVDLFFFIELGTKSGIGSGILWMKTEDSLIAQNMHNIVGDAMNKYGRLFPSQECDDDSFDWCQTRPRINSLTNSSPHNWNIQMPPSQNNSARHRNRACSESCTFQGVHRGALQRSTQRHLDPLPSSFREIPGSNDSFMSSDEDYIRSTPDKEKDDCSEYFPMNQIGQDVIDGLQISFASGVNCAYVTMTNRRYSETSRGCHPPTTLFGLSSRSPDIVLGGISSIPSPGRDDYLPMSPPAVESSNEVCASESPYLEMGHGATISANGSTLETTASTPIPIAGHQDTSYQEMSPPSGNSSSTSRTTSSDQLQELEETSGSGDQLQELGVTSGSGSTVGYSFSHVEDFLDRPIRTSSVGSKPEQYKRMNRLDAVSGGEQSRTRACSVGSRIPLKPSKNDPVVLGSSAGEEIPTCTGESFLSIQKAGSEVKCKSCSVPMLAWSPVSHSWSGTPGSYFRGIAHNKQQLRESNCMMVDYSNPNIAVEEKEKKGFWSSISGHRIRSNSKSSGSSNPKISETSRDKKLSECDTKAMEIPLKNRSNDYCEIDYNNSPSSTSSDPCKGYLPMQAANFLSPSNASDTIERKLSTQSTYLEMSPSLPIASTQDGYVDMTQSGNALSITIGGSSSSSSQAPVGRRISNVQNPMSLELTSPQEEDFMAVDALTNERVLTKKGSRKNSKGKPFKDSSRSRKSDPGSFLGRSIEVDIPETSKSKGPLSTITSLITRKSHNAKSPISPQPNMFHKSGANNSSPFSSLTRTKSKETKEIKEFDLVEETEDKLIPPASPKSGVELCSSKMAASNSNIIKSIESTLAQSASNKKEEKMLFTPLNPDKLPKPLRRESIDSILTEHRKSAYMNMTDITFDSKSIRSKPIASSDHHSSSESECRNYVNMSLGTPSPQISQDELASCRTFSSAKYDRSTSLPFPTKYTTEDYMMINASKSTPSSSNEVVRRPEVPLQLLNHICTVPTPNIDNLSLSDVDKFSTERSRSHSGPGPSDVGTKIKKIESKLSEDGRATSACSSPVSYSPPVSPVLGSMSSVSSLSEGGLSSASSTGTVRNVDVARLNQTISPHIVKPQTNVQQSESPKISHSNTSEKQELLQPEELLVASNPSQISVVTKLKGDKTSSLNYVSLDLRELSEPSPRSRRRSSNIPSEESSYVEIDFVKSEGLRNTSLVRDLKRQ